MIVLALILTLSLTVIALAATVALDGYGSRPGPRSHEDHDQHPYDAQRTLR